MFLSSLCHPSLPGHSSGPHGSPATPALALRDHNCPALFTPEDTPLLLQMVPLLQQPPAHSQLFPSSLSGPFSAFWVSYGSSTRPYTAWTPHPPHLQTSTLSCHCWLWQPSSFKVACHVSHGNPTSGSLSLVGHPDQFQLWHSCHMESSAHSLNTAPQVTKCHSKKYTLPQHVYTSPVKEIECKGEGDDTSPHQNDRRPFIGQDKTY